MILINILFYSKFLTQAKEAIVTGGSGYFVVYFVNSQDKGWFVNNIDLNLPAHSINN